MALGFEMIAPEDHMSAGNVAQVFTLLQSQEGREIPDCRLVSPAGLR
jgi:hypothetical protein